MIAVVGANGQIGSWLLQRFLAWNEPVVAIHRGTLSPRLSRYTLDHRVADLGDYASTRRAVEGCRVVVNLAVEKSGASDRTDLVRANVRDTQNLVRACREAKVERFVHVSSIAVLPPRVTPAVVAAPTAYSTERDAYTRSKIAAERVVLEDGAGLDTCMVRPGIVYGPYLWWSAEVLQRCSTKVVHLPSDTDSLCYAVHVLDVVRLLHRLAHHEGPLPQLVYAIHPEEVSWERFHAEHAARAGLALALEKQPYRALRAHTRMDPSRLLPLLLGTPPVQGAFSTPFASRHLMGSLYRAKNSLDDIRYTKAGDGDGSTASRMHWWPTRTELELLSCSGKFPPELTGRTVGFEYAFPLARGTEGVGLWWKFAVPAQSPMEERHLATLLKIPA